VSLGRFDPSRVSAGRPAGLAGKFVVMHHGTLGLDRGLPETVEAMRLLRPSYPDIVLYLLGDGSEEGRLRTLVRTHGLDNVLFTPTVDHEQVPVHIQGCDVGILPLAPTPVMRSSSPLKLMEYLAMEKPVIVSRIEAFSDVLEGYPGAVFLDGVTPEAIARGIEAAYRQREVLARAAAAGRRIVKERFSWERQAEALWAFLARGGRGAR
jgi:glycosyltransferase involved in cell wall biosynthesis